MFPLHKGTEMKEAMFYRKLENSKVACFLCAQFCRIEPGKRGLCGVRENRDGTLLTLVYGKLIAQNVDPIEKKPLYHFYPGTRSYSIATVGCNFHCLFCQNADISQAPREYRTIFGQDTHPENVIAQAQKTGCATISYTYTEPTVFMEYALDIAERAHEVGIRNIFVSNGYMSREALEAISPFLDAANVDLKAYTDDFYTEQCGAHLKPVLQTLEEMKKRGIWIEVTTLLIPGLNDSPDELKQLAGFLAELDPAIPWHISRFHPFYRLTDRSVTSLQRLHLAREIGHEAGLHHVYTGNVPGDDGENTYCHKCKGLLVERFGFSIQRLALLEGKCLHCGTPLGGIGIA
jgi:pyruvate formate lyase activating enzyme